MGGCRVAPGVGADGIPGQEPREHVRQTSGEAQGCHGQHGRSVEPPGQDDDAAREGESDGLSKQEEVLALKDVQSGGRGVRDELKVVHGREDGHEHARLYPVLAEDVPERQRGEHERKEERPQGGDGQ